MPATCDCCTVMLVFRFMRRVYSYNAHLLSRGKQSIGLFSYRSPSSPVGGFAGKIKTQYPNRVLGFMVPATGLEPVRFLRRGILSPLCLPIPPRRQLKNLTQKAVKRQPFCGDPDENRTRVTAVKGRCLNRLTTGPYGSGNRT